MRQTLLVILGYAAIGCRDVCVSNSDIGVGESICNEFILQKALSIQREEQCTGEIAVANVELVHKYSNKGRYTALQTHVTMGHLWMSSEKWSILFDTG